MKSLRIAGATLLSLSIALSANACTREQAFGFPFDEPVPADATPVKETLLQGGGVGNALASFNAPVPEPLADFDQYAYWSNRDRASVHAIVAYRALIDDADKLQDELLRNTVLTDARIQLTKLREEWHGRYGFDYEATSDSGLTWRASRDGVESTIGVLGGQYLYVECRNSELDSAAIRKAIKSGSR